MPLVDGQRTVAADGFEVEHQTQKDDGHQRRDDRVHHFRPDERILAFSLPARSRAALLRNQFYCALESLLLEYVML